VVLSALALLGVLFTIGYSTAPSQGPPNPPNPFCQYVIPAPPACAEAPDSDHGWTPPVAFVLTLLAGVAVAARTIRTLREVVPPWHGAKLIVVTAVALLVGATCASIASDLDPSRGADFVEVFFVSGAFGLFSAGVLTAVILPIATTWIWLTAREKR